MVSFEITDPIKLIIHEIKNTSLDRDNIAVTYAIIITRFGNKANWLLINTLIINRWSRSGLEYIKSKAWKLVEQTKEDV